MASRPIAIILLAAYLALTGALGFVVAVFLSANFLSLDYINGFTIFGAVLSMAMIIPATLSLAAAYSVWCRRSRTAKLIKWAMITRVILSIFPPGFVGALGVGPWAVPADVVVLIYAFTKRAKNYFAPSSSG